MGRRPITASELKYRRSFGELLRQRRLELGIALREAARRAGIEHSVLARIEDGSRPTHVSYLPRLEEAYQAPAEILQLARSGQIPSKWFRSLFEVKASHEVKRTEVFSARATPMEKKQMMLFLTFLRFAETVGQPLDVGG